MITQYRQRWLQCQPSVKELEKIKTALQALPGAMGGEFHNLDIEPIRATRHRGVFRLKVRPYRIFFKVTGKQLLILELDRRDDNTYSHLDRIAFHRSGDGVDIVDVTEARQEPEPVKVRGRVPARMAQRSELSNPLLSFTKQMLRQLGLDDDAINAVRAAGEAVDIAWELGARGVAAETVELIADAWRDPARYLTIFDGGRIPTAIDAAIDDAELEARLGSADSVTSVARLDGQDLEQVLGATIDEWMFYLHPSQERVVRHNPTGPSRVRGGPGTGKTVAALHRAKHLVREGEAERVLLTTFVRVLPTTWRRLLERFAPEAADKIVTSTVDSLAARIVSAVDGPQDIITDEQARQKLAGEALRDAAVTGRTGSWFTAEVDVVLAGRGLTDLDAYLEVSRAGRGSALSRADRAQVWEAYGSYKRRLQRTGRTDFGQLRLRALQLAREGHGDRYDAVIVDESQDLTAVHVELLKALDRSDGHRSFMLVGDGQQSVYPGGFSLRSVNLDVRGRSWVLRSNWRNTQSIMDVAVVVLGEQSVRDLEDDTGVPGDVAPPRRLGDPAELHLAGSERQAVELAADLLREALVDLDPAEIAVLGRTKKVADRGIAAIRAAGGHEVRITDLPKSADGAPGRIRSGTFEYSKGLEFKLVVLLGPERSAWSVNPYWLDESGDAKEWWDGERRRLFVAMTRARDRLAVIASCPLPPVLEKAGAKCVLYPWT